MDAPLVHQLSRQWLSLIHILKSELLVIADQHAAVKTFPGLVHTARHTMGVANTQSRSSNLREDAV